GIRSNRFSHYFRTFILHLSPYIVANSHAGLKANNLKRGMVLYNGIAPKFIGKLSIKEKKTRRESMLPEANGKLLFVSVANLVPYKDYFSILEALKELNTEKVDFHYLILGDGPLRSEIEETIKQYGLNENITLLGNVENVHEYLKISDIFIHSSKGEGCSNAILEAMAAGLPIVASNTGGTSEIVDEKNGILFEYKIHGQIKNALLEFVNSMQRMEKAENYSLSFIQEKFTIERMMKEYYSFLNEIAKR
ncbi:MAG: glycosyltransferase, partial [Bacteroidota bacterium]